MKKLLSVLLVLGLGVLLVTGCQTAQKEAEPTKTLDDATAEIFSEMGVEMALGITEAMGAWAASGDVTGVFGFGVKGASVKSKTVTGPLDGWYHLTEQASMDGTTYDIDLYVKFTLTGDNVTGVSVYGTYSYATTGMSFVMTFGNGRSDPFV
ncbi:MAG: hypothetical protein V3T21_03340, partial [Candidatus Margulisiibacteriota bacterium]